MSLLVASTELLAMIQILESVPGGTEKVWNNVKSGVGCTAQRLKVCARDTDFFQKIAQVIASGAMLKGASNPAYETFSRFATVLGTASLHDFYHIAQQPFEQLFPITFESVDEKKLLQWLLNYLKKYNAPRYLEVKNKHVKQMKLFFNKEGEKGFPFHSIEKLRESFCKHWDIDSIKLDDYWKNEFKGVIRPKSLLDKVINKVWLVVDIGCVTSYLSEWNLLDTAKWAAKIGQYQGFQWINKQKLENWVVASVVTGFALKLVSSVAVLRNKKSTQPEKQRARWDVVTSVAESALYGTMLWTQLRNKRGYEATINWLTIGAKSLGIMSIFFRPAYELFENSKRPRTEVQGGA